MNNAMNSPDTSSSIPASVRPEYNLAIVGMKSESLGRVESSKRTLHSLLAGEHITLDHISYDVRVALGLEESFQERKAA